MAYDNTDPYRSSVLQNISQLLKLPDQNYASYGLDKIDNQSLWNMVTNLDQRRNDSTIKASSDWFTNNSLGSAISPYVNAAFNPNISVNTSGKAVYTNPDGKQYTGAPSNAGGTLSYTPPVTNTNNTTNTNNGSTTGTGTGLTTADLNSWWNNSILPTLSSQWNQYSNQNNTNNTGNNNQGLSTLYPRVNWGNYQTNNRGANYFNSGTGNYTLDNTITMGT